MIFAIHSSMKEEIEKENKIVMNKLKANILVNNEYYRKISMLIKEAKK